MVARVLVAMALAHFASAALGQPVDITQPTPRDAAWVAEILGYDFAPIATEAPRHAVRLFDSWTRTIVAADFCPPADAPRLVHFGEGETCDALSVSYLVGGRRARIVHTRFIFTAEFAIEGGQPPTLAAAEQIVPSTLRRVLREDGKLNVSVHEMEGGFYGRQPQRPLMREGRLNLMDRNWTDSVHWWLSQGTLRLACVKVQPLASGLPDASRESNRAWFRFYEGQ